MAVTAANITANDDASGGSSVATASVSLVAGRLYVLSVSSIATATVTGNVPTVTGASQTWALIASKNTSSPNARRTIAMFRCLPTANASGVLTIDFASQAQANTSWSLSEFQNVPIGGNGSTAIVQSASTEWNTTNTGATVTLAAFGSASNATHAAVRQNGTGAITAESGYTELSSTTTNQRMEAEFKASSDTTPSWTWASVNNTGLGIAVEIAVAVPVTVTPGVTALVTATFAPVVQLAVIPPVTALALTTFAPVVGLAVIPPVTALVLTKYAPVVGLAVIPPVTALVLTTFAPTIVNPKSATPDTAALVLTEYAPVVTVGIIATPDAAALVLATFVPTVLTPRLVTPPTTALVLTAYAPVLRLVVIPPARALVLTTYAPVVTVALAPVYLRLGRRLVQMHALVYSQGDDGGPDTVKLDLTPEMLNLTWQRSLNLSGTAAWTLARSNPKSGLILPGEDHIMIWRETPQDGAQLVFQGKVASHLPGPGDVVFRAIDYLGYLQRTRTGYRTLYPTKKVGSEIVAPEWALVKAMDRGPLNFVTTGTIQDPLALDGITAVTTNSKFGVILFDRLFTFFALAEMSMTNTDNNVVFEITLSETAPTFNFWKNRSTDATDPVLFWPGNLTAFSYAPGHDELITDLASVVKKVGGGQEAYVAEASDGMIDTYRRLQSAITIDTLMGLDSGEPESDQMKASVQRLLTHATRLPKMFVALPRYAEVNPADLVMGDNYKTFAQKLGSETDQELGEYLRLISVAASWQPDGGEQVQMWLRGK